MVEVPNVKREDVAISGHSPMKILRLDRGEGKTTRLIKMSNQTSVPIVCSNTHRGRLISHKAEEMKLDIPKPISVRNVHGLRGLEAVLIDDVEDVLRDLIGCNIPLIATLAELYVE